MCAVNACYTWMSEMVIYLTQYATIATAWRIVRAFVSPRDKMVEYTYMYNDDEVRPSKNKNTALKKSDARSFENHRAEIEC